MVPFARSFDLGWQIETFGRSFDALVLVCGSQMGKTDTVLDVFGQTLDQRPAPCMYVGPTKEWLNKEFEPRLSRMITTTRGLSLKLAAGKRNNTVYKKTIGGVPINLVWAGSAATLRGTASKISIVDELDAAPADVQANGDAFSLLASRGYSFRDSVRAAISTPLVGTVDTEIDPASGLEIWRVMDSEDVQSQIWRQWQNGTRHHFAWPCLHCGEYFIPRFKQLKIPEGATPAEAARAACVMCPHCGGVHTDSDKAELNRRGVYVAPGQRVERDGTVVGPLPETTILSFWASGLCSPFVSFGKRAADYVAAKGTGEQTKIQVEINTGFGECYAPGGGDVPEWEEVAALARPYIALQLPSVVRMLTMAVDVQLRSLYYTIDGWSAHGTRWTIDYGELLGSTTEKKVWSDLGQLLKRPIGGMVVRRCFIDSGFRPGKPINLPVNRVYEFCRLYPRLAFPTKGHATLEKPIRFAKIEINAVGAAKKYGLDLVHVDTDWAKSSVHERIRKDAEMPGAWCLPENVTEGFCRAIVSEARVRKPNGEPTWVRRSRDNHYLDCEALQEALGFSLNAHLIEAGEQSAAPPPQPVKVGARRSAPPPRPAPAAPAAATPAPAPQSADTADAKSERRKRIADAVGRLYGR